MDVTIQINSPVLVAGESFRVKYRTYPGGTFGSSQIEDNDPFTLTGLSVGQYELEITVIKGDVECPATLQIFEVVEPFECLEFEAEIVGNANYTLFNLEITYTPTANPPCGWRIEVTGNTTNKTVYYATLPASPLLIPVNNEGLLVRIIADLCNEEQICFEQDTLPVPDPPCTGLTIVGTPTIIPISLTQYEIEFDITQSSPATTAWSITYLQTSPTNQLPGAPDQGVKNFTAPGSQTHFNFIVNPTFDAETRFINYDVRFRDKCGNVFVFSVSYDRF